MALLAAALILAAFAPTLVEMVGEWAGRAEASHGFLMPPLAAYLAYSRRQELLALRRDRSLPGGLWALLAGLFAIPALGALWAGELQLSWFLKPYALVAILGLAIVIIYGMRAFLSLLPVLVVLFLMCPIPGRVERDLTLPLKKTASIIATGLMDVTGLPVLLEGNNIRLPGVDRMWIADACSGIRSLISLVSVAIVGCFFWRRPLFAKLLLVAACVPIAVVVNSLRIWLTGFLSVHVSQKAAQGFFHTCEGFLLFAVAGLVLWGVAAVLGRIFAPVQPREPRPESAALPSERGTALVWSGRTLLLLLLVAATGGVYLFRSRIGAQDADPAVVAQVQARLGALPDEIEGGRYSGEPKAMDEEIVKASGADCYASRVYHDRQGRSFQVYIGGSVRNTESFHAPTYCMPAAGWETLEDGTAPFAAFDAASDARQRRLRLQHGDDHMLVYFWLQAGDRIANHEFLIRWLRLLDLFRGRPLRPAVIVTIYVPVFGTVEETEKAALEFQKAIGPSIRAALAAGDGA